MSGDVLPCLSGKCEGGGSRKPTSVILELSEVGNNPKAVKHGPPEKQS